LPGVVSVVKASEEKRDETTWRHRRGKGFSSRKCSTLVSMREEDRQKLLAHGFKEQKEASGLIFDPAMNQEKTQSNTLYPKHVQFLSFYIVPSCHGQL
jgi:hypothetical protein